MNLFWDRLSPLAAAAYETHCREAKGNGGEPMALIAFQSEFVRNKYDRESSEVRKTVQDEIEKFTKDNSEKAYEDLDADDKAFLQSFNTMKR